MSRKSGNMAVGQIISVCKAVFYIEAVVVDYFFQFGDPPLILYNS